MVVKEENAKPVITETPAGKVELDHFYAQDEDFMINLFKRCKITSVKTSDDVVKVKLSDKPINQIQPTQEQKKFVIGQKNAKMVNNPEIARAEEKQSQESAKDPVGIADKRNLKATEKAITKKESQDSDDECTKVKQDNDDADDEPKAVQKASNMPALGKRKPIVGSSGIGGLNSSFKRKK